MCDSHSEIALATAVLPGKDWELFPRARAHSMHLPSTGCYKNPELDTVFVPEVLDEYNQFVIDESGRRMSTQFNMQVDDNL
jgi:hypothetical protein